MTGDEALWTIAVSLGAGACVGALLGALAALLWRVRRESELRVEVESLRACLKTDEVVSAELQHQLHVGRRTAGAHRDDGGRIDEMDAAHAATLAAPSASRARAPAE